MNELGLFSLNDISNPETQIRIYPLKDKMDFYSTIINWNIKEWGSYWANPEEVANAQYQDRLNDSPPLAYIALAFINGKETPIATFSLVGDVYDFYENKNKLFLSRLIIDKSYRNKGIGKNMVQRAENLAQQFGYEACYLFILTSEKLDKYYESLGWHAVEKRQWQGENEILIMKKELPKQRQDNNAHSQKTNTLNNT